MKKLLTVMGGAILMFGLAFTASAQAAPKVDSVDIEKNGNSYELTITASGYVAESAHFDGVRFDISPAPNGEDLEGFNLDSLSLCHESSGDPYAQSAYCLGDGTDDDYGTGGFYAGTEAHNGKAAFEALQANGIQFEVSGPNEAGEVTWTATFGSEFIRANAGTEFTISDVHLWQGLQVTTLENSKFEEEDIKVTVLADVGISVSPNAGNIGLDAGEDFVLTVQAIGADADLVTALEVDHSMSSSIPEFTVYADSENPYGIATEQKTHCGVTVEGDKSEGPLYVACGVIVEYTNNTNTWTITFKSGKPVFDAIKTNGQIKFYLVLKDEADLFGSMFNVTEDITFAYTFEANPTNVLSLSGFSNQTIRVGDSKTLNGALNLSNYGGIEVTGTQTLSLTSGDADGIEISTSTPDGGTMNPLGVALPFNFKCEGPCGTDLEAGASASIPLDITVKALKQGTYSFRYVANVVGESDPAIDQTFTITVNRKSTGSSGGGGGSRPSQNVDTSTSVSGDILVIDGKSYDLKNLNAQEETVVKGYFLKTIIALLQQIIALKMTQG